MLPDVGPPGDGVPEVEVGAEADVVGADEVDGVDLIHEVVGERRGPRLLREVGGDADHPALLGAGLEGLVRAPPRLGVPLELAVDAVSARPLRVGAHLLRRGGPREDVGEAHRVLGRLDGLHGAPVADVAQVDEDAEPVHLLHESHPEVAEAGVAALDAAVARLVPAVVGELDDADPPFPGDLQEAQVPLEEAAVLGPEDEPVPALLLRLLDVRGLPDYQGLVLLLLGPGVVPGQLLERPAEGAPHADGGVGRRHPALQHVVEPDVLADVVDEGDDARVDDDALPVEGHSVLLLVLAQVKIALQFTSRIDYLSKFKA